MWSQLNIFSSFQVISVVFYWKFTHLLHSSPLLKKLPKRVLLLVHILIELLVRLALAKLFISIGLLLIDELDQAYTQWNPSVGSGSSIPPAPGPGPSDHSVLIAGLQPDPNPAAAMTKPVY